MKKILFFCLILTILVLVLIFGPTTKNTQALISFNPLWSPFGGRVVYKTYCTCSLNEGIIVGSPSGGMFIYEPIGTHLYRNYAISIPNWVLGIAAGYASCLQYYGTTCGPDPVVSGGKVMLMIGTSGTFGF